MLKLHLFLENQLLRVRRAEAHESLIHSMKWKDKIEFSLSSSPIMMMTWSSLLPDLSKKEAHAFVEMVGARFPFSPHHEELKRVCPQLLYISNTDEWVFYGGSFNPWHSGHQSCLDRLDGNKTCFIIPDRNPLKEMNDNDPVTILINMAYNVVFKKNHFLVPCFLMEAKKNPTVEWIEVLKNHYPTQKLSLLMGHDSFSQLQTWIRGQDLLNILDTVYVVSRMESEEKRSQDSKVIATLAPNLKIVFLGRHEYEAVSSTELRKKT